MEPAFGVLLREMREKAGLTQAALAKDAKITRIHVGFLERGERQPSLDVFVRLCRALRVKPSRVMERLEDRM